MRERAPRVSVCVPTRDRARWLGSALDSVLAQTLRDFELIVLDDASGDDTERVVASRRDPRVRYRRQPAPVGVAANRNACLDLARGRYVAWLDSDDRYHPQMLERQSACLDARPSVVLVHGACDVIDTDGERLPDWPAPFEGDVVEFGRTAFRELVLENYVAAPTVMVRRRAHDAVGPYRPSLTSGEDWDMWLRLALRGDLAYTAERLAQYRWHGDSLTRRVEATGRHLVRDRRILGRIFADHRARLARPDVIERRARAALAARGILHATDVVLRRRRLAALLALVRTLRAYPPLGRHPAIGGLLTAALLTDEYRWHVGSRSVLRSLADALEDSRVGERLRRQVVTDPDWHATLRRIARTVRTIVPPADAVAVVDKWDPTLLHLARRRGWHFPDRRTLPDGYPRDSGVAVRHLEQLRRRGARHLVVPCSAFWWLDCYTGLARYLEAACERTWEDDSCVIYRLAGGVSWAA